jgi:hypothetical protein
MTRAKEKQQKNAFKNEQIPKSANYLPFVEARERVRNLHLNRKEEWYKYVRGERKDLGVKPPNIPSRPDYTYRNLGWLGWGDWLGTGGPSPRLRDYMTYEQASEFVRGKGIKSNTAYHRYWRQEGSILLPSNPDRHYRGQGWISWGEFLGTRHFKDIKWRSFKKAREYVRTLGLKSAKKFFRWRSEHLKQHPNEPFDIPSNPHDIYKNQGWQGYGDFLGTGFLSTHLMHSMIYSSFKESKGYIRRWRRERGLNFRKRSDYEEFLDYYKIGSLPRYPDQTYKNEGWKGWADFLGYVRPKLDEWPKYEEARQFVHGLGLKSHKEWIWYCRGDFKGLKKKPAHIPSNPYLVYAGKGWNGWGDWLGSGNIRKWTPSFVPYHEARAFARGLGLKSGVQWKKYLAGKFPGKPKKPENIPSVPDRHYKGAGWVDWKDFLGS